MISEWVQKLKSIKKQILFIGSDLAIHRPTIEEILGSHALFAEITENNPRPSELALLGKNKPGEDIH